MATSQSAKKRIRQNEKHRARNKQVRSKVSTALRNFEESVDAGDLEAAEEAYRNAMSQLDRAARKGVIPKERASRRKSRMAKRLDALR